MGFLACFPVTTLRKCTSPSLPALASVWLSRKTIARTSPPEVRVVHRGRLLQGLHLPHVDFPVGAAGRHPLAVGRHRQATHVADLVKRNGFDQFALAVQDLDETSARDEAAAGGDAKAVTLAPDRAGPGQG